MHARTYAGLAIAALAAGSLVGCASPGTSGDADGPAASKIAISAVYGGTFDPYWTSMICGAQAEADRLGVEFVTHTSTNLEVESFAQNFQAAQLDDPDGIIANPANPNQFLSDYQRLMAGGVPIVTIAGTTPPAQLNIVSTDPGASEFLDDLVDLVPSEEGSMAVLGGIAGLVPIESRLFPIVDAIKEARPDLEALPTEYTFFDVNKSTSYVASMLLAHPDLRVIVAASGPEGQGAAAAVQQAGMSGEVAVIVLGADPSIVQSLKSGVVTALVAQSAVQIGATQVRTLVEYLDQADEGSPVEPSADEIFVPQRLLTSENIDDPDNADWIYNATC